MRQTTSGPIGLLLAAALALGAVAAPRPAAAASIIVTTLTDTVANDGQCSLREAILSANGNPGAIFEGECPGGSNAATDEIVLANGVNYALSIGGADNTGEAGDLDIANNAAALDLVIRTADPEGGPAAISAAGIPGGDRVLQVLLGAGLRLENITVQGGSSAFSGGGIYNAGSLELERAQIVGNEIAGGGFEGAGIYNAEGATLSLADSQVNGNVVLGAGNGAGIANRGSLTVAQLSLIINNRIEGQGDGAGLYSLGELVLSDSAVIANRIMNGGSGAGIANAGGTAELSQVSLVGNLNDLGNGGGLHNAAGGTIEADGSVVSNNVVGGRGGGIFNEGAATLSGTVIGAEADPNQAEDDGGGIYNAAGGQLVISGGAVDGNVAGSADGANAGGGGLYNAGELTLTDVVVSNNRSGDGSGSRGGGIFSRGELTINGGVIRGNRSGDGIDSGGGGIAIYDGVVRATGLEISRNSTGNGASSGGGGVWVRGGAVLHGQGLLVHDNRTGAGAEADGGGIWSDGDVHLRESELSLNRAGGADNDGGGIYTSGIATLVDSAVHGNQASAMGNSADGGGIFTLGALSMLNVTVSGNAARTLGGGIYSGAGSLLTLMASTLSGNSVAEGSAGGLYVDGGAVGASLRLSLIAGNSAGFNPDCEDVLDTISTGGFNLLGIGSGQGEGCPNVVDGVAGDRAGTAAAPLDPQLGPLADNGGPTLTHGLLAGSPARDMAPAASCETFVGVAISADQRGVARPHGGGCDAGAFEAGALLVYLPLTVR